MSLSILIIAYNEEKLINQTITKTINYMKKLKIDHEIIVCINGCTDETENIVLERILKTHKLSIISVGKKGFGRGVRKGIDVASKEWITFIPGDGEGDLTFIERAWKLRKYKYIVGSRYMEEQTRGASKLRSFLSWGFQKVTKLIFPSDLHEIGIMKMFPRKWADGLDLKSNKDDIQIELNYHAIKDKLKIKEIPIKNLINRPASESKASLIRDGFILFKALIKYGVKL